MIHLFQRDTYPREQKTAVSRQMEVIPMKQHRFWAWAAVFCMAMVMFTGYKHK